MNDLRRSKLIPGSVYPRKLLVPGDVFSHKMAKTNGQLELCGIFICEEGDRCISLFQRADVNQMPVTVRLPLTVTQIAQILKDPRRLVGGTDVVVGGRSVFLESIEPHSLFTPCDNPCFYLGSLRFEKLDSRHYRFHRGTPVQLTLFDLPVSK